MEEAQNIVLRESLFTTNGLKEGDWHKNSKRFKDGLNFSLIGFHASNMLGKYNQNHNITIVQDSTNICWPN